MNTEPTRTETELINFTPFFGIDWYVRPCMVCQHIEHSPLPMAVVDGLEVCAEHRSWAPVIDQMLAPLD